MSRSTRNPNRFGTDMRARKRQDTTSYVVSECITRAMTNDERARIEALPKPQRKERIIGMNVTVDRAMKNKGYSG